MKDGQPSTIYLKDYEVPPFLIDKTDLNVDIRPGQTTVTANLTMRRNPDGQRHEALVLDGSTTLNTQSIAVNGVKLNSNEYRQDDDKLTIFAAPDSFVLTTTVDIVPEDNTALEGLYRSGGMYCTQCEAEGFRNITWFLDRPDVMSQFQTTVIGDRKTCPVLLSNGNATARGEDGERHWVTWNDPFVKPAYLFALVAGDLQHIEDTFTTMSGREVTLQIFTEAHNIDKVDFAMDSLKRSMAWDEQVYGREYDLDIFMIVAVESFNMGAMENKGLNIFNTSCVLARPDTTTDAGYQRVEAVVAHEYFHNWSGNRVTCRDWFQLSLKEGFTVLRDQQFSADMGSATVCRIADVDALRRMQFPEDAGPMAHPIRPDSFIEINNFYTATVYEKGAEVVRMIYTLLGADRFRKGCDLYFDRHDGQAVTTEDFVVAMEQANDVDLRQFRLWYEQAGTPVVRASGVYDPGEGSYTLTLSQSCPATPGQPDKQPVHMPIAIGLLDEAGNDIVLDTSAADVASIVADDGSFTAVLNLSQQTQQYQFKGLNSEPVPSLLRGFSAPVRLDAEFTRDQLVFLMSHDSDGFNRWEAGQRLCVDVINECVVQHQAGESLSLDQRLVEAFEKNLTQSLNEAEAIDRAMLARVLQLPSASYLVELSDVADVDAINTARTFVRQQLGQALKGLWLTVYKQNQVKGDFDAGQSSIARRALKNEALDYLVAAEDEAMLTLCQQQFEAANCMTDTSRAIQAMLNSELPAARGMSEVALTEFYNRWAEEALVIDHWFSIQALCGLPGAIARVRQLMTHEAFTMKNPNRMRALVMAFTENLTHFHGIDGEGYRFLADRVIELNAINPQMAARALRPLTRWQKFDAKRQQLMTAELDRILAEESLSPDVYEIASKSAR